MPNNVKLLNCDELVSLGVFTLDEIEAAKKHPDHYVGTKAGVMYFRSDLEFDTGGLTGQGSQASVPEMKLNAGGSMHNTTER